MLSSWRQKSIPQHFPSVTVGKVLALALQPLCASVLLWLFVTGRKWNSLGHWAVQWLHWEALAQLKTSISPAAQPSLVCGLQISQIHEVFLRHQWKAIKEKYILLFKLAYIHWKFLDCKCKKFYKTIQNLTLPNHTRKQKLYLHDLMLCCHNTDNTSEGACNFSSICHHNVRFIYKYFHFSKKYKPESLTKEFILYHDKTFSLSQDLKQNYIFLEGGWGVGW